MGGIVGKEFIISKEVNITSEVSLAWWEQPQRL